MLGGNPNASRKPGLGYGSSAGRKSHSTTVESILGGLSYQSNLPTLNSLGYQPTNNQSLQAGGGPQDNTAGSSYSIPGLGGGATYDQIIEEVKKQLANTNKYGSQILSGYDTAMSQAARSHKASLLQYDQMMNDLMNTRMPVSEGVWMAGY